MENLDDLFIDGCILPCIGEVEKTTQPPHKDLDTLLKELDVIKSDMEEIKFREWHLAKLVKFHEAGLEV